MHRRSIGQLAVASLAVILAFGVSCSRKPEALPEPSAPPSATFGAALSGQSPRQPLKAVLEDPARFEGQTVTVEGRVRRACSRKGCWMELAESLDGPDPGCRVSFKDYGFFVPTDSQGATATVEGVVAVKRVPRGRVSHLEAEGAKFAQKNPDGTANEVQLVATGVEMVR